MPDANRHVSLREFLVQQIRSAEEKLHIRLDAHREETRRGQAVLDERLEGMNKFREQLTEERATFVRRDLHDQLERQLSDRIVAVERWQWKIVGGLAIVGLFEPIVVALIVHFFGK